MNYEIRTWPDKILKKKMQEVVFFDNKLKELVNIMFKRMYKLKGVGLAANQIGIPYQILVLDTNTKKYDGQEGKEGVKMALVNPKIIEKFRQVKSTEGCLSFPGIQITIPRAERVKVLAQDLEGNEIEIDTDGFLAIVLQHEIDHLNGIPFINYLSPVKRKLVLEKYMKSLKEMARA